MDMSTLLRDESGYAYGCLGILFDITDRKLAEQNLEKAYQEMEADLNMAREVQMAFLEKHPSHFPESIPIEKSDLQFYHRYLPATTLAGDFFNIIPISKHKVGIFICDVMGHGARASLLTAYIQGLIEELMPVAADTGAFVKKLNIGMNSIMAQFTTGVFATVFYLVIDTKAMRMSYTNAGHPKPLVLRRSQGIVENIQFDGKKSEPALGLFKDFNYSVFKSQIKKDDIILFYTDGIYEVENTEGLIFGKDRLFDTVQSQLSTHPDQLLDKIINELNSFSKSNDFRDDVCLVTMHVGHGKER
jgi:sigma-B regulation protein RsbU (phosphoserine phosphatase)